MQARRAAPSPVVPSDPDLETARTWLKKAKRPVMIVGLDVLTEGSAGSVQSFAEAWGIPVITTYKAKGVLPEDHRLSLGGAGLSPKADGHLLPYVQDADLVIGAGYDPIEMRTGWRDAWDPTRQRVIDIHAEPNHHYMHQAGLSFVAHTGATLDLLARDATPSGTAEQLAMLKSELSEVFPVAGEWGPGVVIAEARDVLPQETIATVDSGAHRILLSQMWKCPAPRTLLQSSGLCTMGCAVPLAMGAKLAAPDRPVVAFTGDAGFLMVVGELSTAVEMDLPVIVVVFVDASLGLIEVKQRQRQLANAGVDFAHHDFAVLAKGFGAEGYSVSDRAGLRVALTDALDAKGPVVIAAEIARQAYDGRI